MTAQLKAAAQLALSALESLFSGMQDNERPQKCSAAINALRAALAADAVPIEPRTSFVQPVPDHCDRIIWRNQYFHLLLKAAPQPATESPSMSLLVCLTCRHIDSSPDTEPCNSCINSAQHFGNKYTRWQAK